MTAKKRKFPEIELTPELIADVIHKANKPVKLDDILAMLKVKRNRKRDVEFLLHALELDGRLIRSRGSWFPPKNRPLARGVLSIQRSGAGFVIPEEAGKGDIFIAPLDLKDAWDGDIVEVAIMPHRQGPSREGRITRVLEKSQKLVPVFATRKQGEEWLATPQHSGLQVLFCVDVSQVDSKKTTPVLPTYDVTDAVENSAVKESLPVKEDDLLLVMPLEKIGPGLWSAKAVVNLYSEESPAAQELLAKIGHGIPMEFPPSVMSEVALMPEDPLIDERILHQREDLRDIPFVTIDGADAKDFDDAVYVEKTAKGYRLLVAIADVSYYVINASAIDNEARRRGNSYYFPLSVEPMLPEVLSNGLCSLKPKAPRLAMVAEMFFSEKGVETSSGFCSAVVESKARLTYSQVYAAAVEKNLEMQQALQTHMPMLDDAFALAAILGRKRSERGSLDFDLPEAQFIFDKNGDVEAITPRKNTKANNLIEEFMIAANEAVARFLTDKKRYLLYRVHEAPNMEKLEALKNFILQTHLIDLPQGLQGAGSKQGGRGSRHGFTQKKTETPPPSPLEFKAILQAARGTPQEYTVNRLLLRAMMQARYSPDNLGHFGLASTCYCHFTSPIRRYADLVVHRALKAALGLGETVYQEQQVRQGFEKSRKDNDFQGKSHGASSERDAVTADKKIRLERVPQTVWVKEKQAIEGVSFESNDQAEETKNVGHQTAPLGAKGSAKKVRRIASSPQSSGSPLGAADELTLQRLEVIADHINNTERSAMEAERETHKRLAALYLRNHIGEDFDGVVSGVTDFGIFVELTSCLSEGMVRLSSLDDDYYHYLQDRQMLRGERTGRKFSVGLPVRVRIVDVSLQRFEVTLAILPEEGEAGGGRKNRVTSEESVLTPKRTRTGKSRVRQGKKDADGKFFEKKGRSEGKKGALRKQTPGGGQSEASTSPQGEVFEGGRGTASRSQPPKKTGRKVQKKNIASKQKKKR